MGGVRSLALLVHFVITFCFTAGAEPPDAEKVGFGQVKLWAESQLRAAENDFSGKRKASPEFWGAEIVYQIQADRFNDGDPANNDVNIEFAQKNGDLRAILSFHHGGDLKGIEQRLDYLHDLGVTTLWITPVLKHNGAYHGYCTTDPMQIDPSFGTNEDFRRLVAEAHRRGMYVVMDVVINHLCDRATKYARAPDHYRCAGDLDRKNWSGEPGGSPGQGELAFSPDFFGPLKSQYFFNRCGANSTADMQGTGPAAVYGDFVDGMFDFDTRNHDFQEIFTSIYNYWIAYADVDGFRLDAAKHVSEDFVAYISTHAREYARTLKKNNFLVVGEVAGPSDWIARRLGAMSTNPRDPGDHGNVPAALTSRIWDLKPVYETHPTSRYPGLTAAYDFAHGGTAVDVLHGFRPPMALEQQFRSTYFNDLAAQNDYRLNWNLLEIHDWPRFASRNKKSMEKSILGAAYLAFAEETPIIYYGFEQGFNGDCHWDSMNLGSAASAVRQHCSNPGEDALFRQDMFMGGMVRLGSTVPEIDRLAYVGPPQRHRGNIDPYLNTDHALFKASRRFLHIRRSCKALKYGSTLFRWVEQNAGEGVLAFSRVDRVGPVREALVIINTSGASRALPDMRVESDGGGWKNLLNGFEQAQVDNGIIRFGGLRIGSNSVMIFVPGGNAAAFNPELESHLCVE